MPVYKYEERGTWYCSFYYDDWTGQRKRKKKEGFKTQREAKAFERDFLNKSKANNTMTFKSLVEHYLEDCKTRLKPTTYQVKQYAIASKIAPYFNDMVISDISVTAVRKWQNDLLNKDFTPTYVHKINGDLSAIMNFAVKYHGLAFNPVARCGSIGKAKADTMQFWTLEEFNQFIAAVKKPEFKLLFELLFYTGIREGEALALTLNDFNFNTRELSIEKSLATVNGKTIIQTPKTAKSIRKIAIPDFLCNDVREYIKTIYGYKPGQRIFLTNKHTIAHEMARICKASGVKKIRVHDIRHSHASLLIELGFPILLISERLGHENINTTLQTYSHLYPNKQSEVADKLQNLRK
jgi:integrase